MAAYTWPTSLPQKPLRDGFYEVGGVNVIRTPMDKGPARTRRLSRQVKPIQVTFLMTKAQIVTLEDFVENTLFGVRRFNFTHPRKLASVEVRIVPGSEGVFYTLSPLGVDLWQVSMTFEVLP